MKYSSLKRKLLYAFQIFIFAWACASTIHIGLNMFLWLLNGIFLGIILCSHRKRKEEPPQDWVKLHFLTNKTLYLLRLVLATYDDLFKIALSNITLSDDALDDLLKAKIELLDHVTVEVSEIEAIALKIKTDNETINR